MIDFKKTGKVVSLGGGRFEFTAKGNGEVIVGEVFRHNFNWQATIPYGGRKFCVISETRIGAVRAAITSLRCAVNRGLV